MSVYVLSVTLVPRSEPISSSDPSGSKPKPASKLSHNLFASGSFDEDDDDLFSSRSQPATKLFDDDGDLFSSSSKSTSLFTAPPTTKSKPHPSLLSDHDSDLFSGKLSLKTGGGLFEESDDDDNLFSAPKPKSKSLRQQHEVGIHREEKCEGQLNEDCQKAQSETYHKQLHEKIEVLKEMNQKLQEKMEEQAKSQRTSLRNQEKAYQEARDTSMAVQSCALVDKETQKREIELALQKRLKEGDTW